MAFNHPSIVCEKGGGSRGGEKGGLINADCVRIIDIERPGMSKLIKHGNNLFSFSSLYKSRIETLV